MKFQHKKDVESLIGQFSELRQLKTESSKTFGPETTAEDLKNVSKTCSKIGQKSSKSVEQFSFQPIGYVHSCHASKNGSPRQPSVSPDSRGAIDISQMSERFNNAEYSLQNLEEFSHIWIVFVFHLNDENFVKTKVT